MSSLAVDLLAAASVFGIWPRFVEPKLICTTHLDWDTSFSHLDRLKVVHITDLHFHKKVSSRFLRRLSKKIGLQKPDLILFTGDFLCYSNLEDEGRLLEFLNSLHASLGCFCSLGNHDYARYTSRNAQGIYDMIAPPTPLQGVMRGLACMARPKPVRVGVAASVKEIGHHRQLLDLLEKTPFQLLENQTVQLPLGLNVTGLGDLALGRFDPEKAFENFDATLPGFVLSHNPDTLPELQKFPGHVHFAGHTHGEQIHLPFLRTLSQRLARSAHPEYTRGLVKRGEQLFYTSRGLGAHKPFRLCSPPEILVMRCKKRSM